MLFRSYLTINNSQGNFYDMYSGYNKILERAKGEYVILVHQDVMACFDTRTDLEINIRELDNMDATWAVVGNAGTNDKNEWCVRISDPHGKDWKQGRFPEKATMLDGNFLLIKKSSLIAFSSDLSGFHYYGWDICLNADIRGYSAYVIDWHIFHAGKGNVDSKFYDCKKRFEDKWNHALRDRTIGAWDHDRVKIARAK